MATNDFSDSTQYVVCGEHVAVEVVEGPKGLANALREHGPEDLTVYAQLWDGSLEELVQVSHGLVGVDDLAKYYVTAYESPRTSMVAEIGWDI